MYTHTYIHTYIHTYVYIPSSAQTHPRQRGDQEAFVCCCFLPTPSAREVRSRTQGSGVGSVLYPCRGSGEGSSVSGQDNAAPTDWTLRSCRSSDRGAFQVGNPRLSDFTAHKDNYHYHYISIIIMFISSSIMSIISIITITSNILPLLLLSLLLSLL